MLIFAFASAAQRLKPIIPILGMIVPAMGNKPSTFLSSLVASALFTPVQQRVLAVLYGQPDRAFRTSELIQMVGSGTGAAHRLLGRLVEADLVKVRTQGNQRMVRANEDSPVFEELRALVRKTIGLRVPLEMSLQPLADQIDAAFVYGSVAKGTERAGSDVDLLVLSDALSYPDLFEVLSSAESAIGRPINPTVMSRAEWKRKRKSGDTFASRIAKQPRLFVIGDEGDAE